MRRILILFALMSLSVPAGALADDQAPSTSPQQSASATCKAELAKMGAATFKLTYGTNANHANAFGKCVAKHTATAAHAADNAAKQCKAERASGEDAFVTKYGTNKNGKNAFGKCVSQKAKAAGEHEAQADVSAAKSCKAERKADPVAFGKKYGNFGGCVSTTAKTN